MCKYTKAPSSGIWAALGSVDPSHKVVHTSTCLPLAVLWGCLKRSAHAVQLFGRLAVVETHTLWYFGHHCCLVVGFDALGIWHFWMFTLFHPFLLFLHTFFTHFHHIYSFSRLIDMVVHFEGACYRTSYFPPHFSGHFSPWISVLGIGCSTPAPMACNLMQRWLGRLKTDSSTWNTTKMG